MEIDIPAELAKIRAERQPTKRGAMLLTNYLGQMIIQGFANKDLDGLELLFWIDHDGDGRNIRYKNLVDAPPNLS